VTSASWSADVLVVFGITGDLAYRMTIPALYELEHHGQLDCAIVGVAGRQMSRLPPPAVLPGSTARVVRADCRAARCRRAAAGVEAGAGKPFGHDLGSARALSARLHQLLDEQQTLRVDHFLGKQPVIELEYLRFANFALAQLWDRDSVTAIEITMAETLRVDDRGHFYDHVGALLDVVQNHLLQVVALVAMDPPVGPSADDLRDKKAELRAMPDADPATYVRGQYHGYRKTPGVAADSDTETYAALRLEIDNFRWAGVPIFIRAVFRDVAVSPHLLPVPSAHLSKCVVPESDSLPLPV
jgi:glucose-6-phosphate 1-dehydrogenase